jgi:ParB/RepB/Spo0J family partition protein
MKEVNTDEHCGTKLRFDAVDNENNLDCGTSPLQGDVVLQIPLTKISPNPKQPRRYFKEDLLLDLCNSIKETGVLTPITVREKKGDADAAYEIIFGERRFRACRMAGKEYIPAIIKNIDDNEAAAQAAIENLQRQDLIFIDEMETVVSSYKRLGSSEAAGLELARDRKTVDRYRKIHLAIHLNEDFEQMIEKDAFKITYTVANNFAEIAANVNRLKKGSAVERRAYVQIIAKINKAIDTNDCKDKKGGLEKSLGSIRSLLGLKPKKKEPSHNNDLIVETDNDLTLRIRIKKTTTPPENATDIVDSIRKFIAAAGLTL